MRLEALHDIERKILLNGRTPMKHLVHAAAFMGIGAVIGALAAKTSSTANAQLAPPSVQSGAALWH